MDLHAVWSDGKWGRSRVEIVEGKGAVSAVNVGHPIVTNGDLVALLFSAVRGGDAALPKLLWDFLLKFSNKLFEFRRCMTSRVYYGLG